MSRVVNVVGRWQVRIRLSKELDGLPCRRRRDRFNTLTTQAILYSVPSLLSAAGCCGLWASWDWAAAGEGYCRVLADSRSVSRPKDQRDATHLFDKANATRWGGGERNIYRVTFYKRCRVRPQSYEREGCGPSRPWLPSVAQM